MQQENVKVSHEGQSRVEEGYLVMDWMQETDVLSIEAPFHHVVELMLRSQQPNRDIIITSAEGIYLGMLSPISVIRWFHEGDGMGTTIPEHLLMTGKAVNLYDSIIDIPLGEVEVFPVVDNQGRVQGRLSSNALLLAYQQLLSEKNHIADALDIVLETAYEGIVMVNSQGIIVKMNEAYKNFLSMKDEEVLYKPVEKVIENTRLHVTVRTGIPERSTLQTIQGQNMVVHRLPIWRDNKIVGALGMLIFEGVSELFRILEQVNEANRATLPSPVQTPTSAPSRKLVTFEDIKHESQSLAYCKSLARRAARTEATVLIAGESGTGKEMFAQAIHQLSSFSKGEFVAVNCAAIPENLLESELFGYDEGAFTGAKRGGKKGKFEQANGGTLFLDEIGDMPLQMQAKILRVLQEREIQPVGSNRRLTFSGRVISATHVDLEENIKKGDFREDLYYRLNVIHLQIPSLRERKQDIPVLLSHYLQHFCRHYHLPIKTFTRGAIEALMAYNWPGNSREVMNLVERLVTLVDTEEIELRDLPSNFVGRAALKWQVEKEKNEVGTAPTPLKVTQLEREWQEIQRVMDACNGNKSEAARQLGIHRTTLYQKLRRISGSRRDI
jgi:transcriptional regulator with PAS, ATPase and Fis domain